MLILRQFQWRNMFLLHKNYFELQETVNSRNSFKPLLGFSYIRSEMSELDQKFYDTELKKKTTHPTIKLNYFAKVLWSLGKNGLMI